MPSSTHITAPRRRAASNAQHRLPLRLPPHLLPRLSRCIRRYSPKITSAHAPYNTLASLTTHAHCVEPAATKITTRLITPIIGTAGSTRALYRPPYTLACTTTQHATTCYPTKYPPGHLPHPSPPPTSAGNRPPHPLSTLGQPGAASSSNYREINFSNYSAPMSNLNGSTHHLPWAHPAILLHSQTSPDRHQTPLPPRAREKLEKPPLLDLQSRQELAPYWPFHIPSAL